MSTVKLSVAPHREGYLVVRGTSRRGNWPQVGQVIRSFDALHFARFAGSLGLAFQFEIVGDGEPHWPVTAEQEKAFYADGGEA